MRDRGKRSGRAYEPTLFSKHFVCTRDFIRGTQMVLRLSKAATEQEAAAFARRVHEVLDDS